MRVWALAVVCLAVRSAATPVVPDTSFDEEDDVMKNLDTDGDWRDMQKSLKDAQDIPDTDDQGLQEAQQEAQIQAFNTQEHLSKEFAHEDLGESAVTGAKKPETKVQMNVDQLMGKLVMSDMFDEHELSEVKKGLLERAQRLANKSGKKGAELGEAKGGKKSVVKAARDVARGLKLKEEELARTKHDLNKANKKLQKMGARVKSYQSEKKQETDMLDSQQTDSNKKVRALHAKYRKDLDNMAAKMQDASTQAAMSHHALQMCEARMKGSTGRAIARVTRRTNRATRRAEVAMHAKQQADDMKKQLEEEEKRLTKAKEVDADEKEVDADDGADKPERSLHCTACSKLSAHEHRLLGVDCGACGN